MVVLKYLQSRFYRKTPSLPFPLLIIESDDWGFVRVPSKQIRDEIEKNNPSLLTNPYIRYDGLENIADIEELVNLLSGVRDCDNNPCVITANFIMGNPDYLKIEQSGFTGFFDEGFIVSYKNAHGSDEVFQKQKYACSERVFVPQYHGMHHVNVNRWMKSLVQADPLTRSAFGRQMVSYHSSAVKAGDPCVDFFLDAMNPANREELNEITRLNKEGLAQFENTWGYKSQTMIAPCYIWHKEMEPEMRGIGIGAFQGQRLQKECRLANNPNDFRRVYHYQGEQHKGGIYYFLRDSFFEPSLDPKIDWVNLAFGQVDSSLKRQGFSILCSHRLNFIGSLEVKNRENCLRGLLLLLKKIREKWPDIRFASTNQLYQYYSAKGDA